MSYAVIRTGGKQYRVAPGDVVRIERLAGDVGSAVEFAEVLIAADDGGIRVGRPLVDGARVRGVQALRVGSGALRERRDAVAVALQERIARVGLFHLERARGRRGEHVAHVLGVAECVRPLEQSGQPVVVALHARERAVQQAPQHQERAERERIGAQHFKDLPGIGQAAFMFDPADNPTRAVTISFLQNNDTVTLQTMGIGADAATALAKAIAASMKKP